MPLTLCSGPRCLGLNVGVGRFTGAANSTVPSAAIPMRHRMRSPTACAIPALSMAPVIIVPVPMTRVGAGDRARGGAYRCAPSAADGSADDGTRHGSSRWVTLRLDLSDKHRRRETDQGPSHQDSNHVVLPVHTCVACVSTSVMSVDIGAGAGPAYAIEPDEASPRNPELSRCLYRGQKQLI